MRSWWKFSAWLVGLLAAGLAPALVGIGNMPDPMASHWGPGGMPDGSLPSWTVVLIPVAMVVVGLALALLFRSDGSPTPEATAISGLVGGVGIAITVITVTLNWGRDSWEEAGSFGWTQFGLVVLTAIAVAWLGYLLGKRLFPIPTRDPVFVPESDPIDADVVWANTISVKWVYALLLPIAAVFLFLPGWFKLIAVLDVVLAVLFSKVRVVVDQTGLTVGFAGALPAKRIPIDQIESVLAIDLEPREWGGWGYRVIPNGSAVVLRKGAAIQVNRVDGRRFAVTIDDAETGAAVLAGHSARVG